MKEEAQSFTFQAEVNRLMHIIINSLYSNREIFLRELISNASDALDKIRFLSLTNATMLGAGDQAKLEILLKIDKERRILHITDRGIGMTKDDLIKNLGTIAQSGTKDFLNKFAEQSDKTSGLIGQFGVGFYSVFLAADAVSVTSKHSDDDQYIWTSRADGTYKVVKDPLGNTLGRGTRISIHLKEDASEFLEESTIRNIAKKYSEFINFPISLWTSKVVSSEVPAEETREEESTKPTSEEGVEVEEEDDEDDSDEEEAKTTTKTETVWDWELLNNVKPIWTRSPKDVTADDYSSFYKVISKDTEAPLKHIHFVAEGEANFKSILYIPSTPPQNQFDPTNANKGSIRLFVRRVFITDDFEGLIPNYLKFIRGVVDSDDMDLNVSREILQQTRLLKQIEKKIIRKAIAMFQEMATAEDKEEYIKFWSLYGTNIKLGVVEDSSNRSRLTKLIMFWSSKTGEYTTLDAYVSRMKEGQDQIYYLAGANKAVVESSPLAEKALKRGYEVLYMVDPIDEYAVQHVPKYDGKFKLTNLGKDGVTFDETEDEQEEKKKVVDEFQPLVDFFKQNFAENIEKVVISDRLATAPCALIANQYGYSANMERIMKAQALHNNRQTGYIPKKIMELNPRHPIVKELLKRVKTEDKSAIISANVLYETALLSSGYTIDDPSKFAAAIHQMMALNMNTEAELVDEQATTEPTPVEKATKSTQSDPSTHTEEDMSSLRDEL
eukprot:TRINITY_DN3574_c0_g1_i1.p1 TRINITY_DN3574_c0_g1~~TRINITY_DN3574_c0_g1_i1.p1  ORF type:complete len:724 (-),score=213.49 TRINITY_DN3574_c0_g1_i1:14-2185(-)